MEKAKIRENQFLYLNQADENGDLIQVEDDDRSGEEEGSYEKSPRQDTGGNDLATFKTRIDKAAIGINNMNKDLIETRNLLTQVMGIWDDIVEHDIEEEEEYNQDNDDLDVNLFRQSSLLDQNDDDQTLHLGHGGEKGLGQEEVTSHLFILRNKKA